MQGNAIRFRAPRPAREYRFGDVIAGMSVALDIGEGHAPGHAQRAATIGLRLASDLALSEVDRVCVLQTLLLKDAGCTGNASSVAELLTSDDLHAKRAMRSAGEWRRPHGAGVLLARIGHLGRTGRRRLARDLSRLRAEAGVLALEAAGCVEAAVAGIASLDERWDGSGQPHGLRGEEIPVMARIASLAQTMEFLHGALGLEAMLAQVEARRGTWFDPALVDVCSTWRSDRLWWHELAYEAQALPASDADVLLDESGLDRLAEAFALVIDGKNPYAPDHSRGVAAVACGIAGILGYDAVALRGLRRAALLHDLGNLSLSSRILDKAAPLTHEERETMCEHPRFTWAVLRRVPAFEEVGWAAALHHERLDGSGYPWGLSENELDVDARIIAIADAYHAVTERRAYREGMSSDTAIRIIGKDSPHRYDARVFRALETWLAESVT